MRDRYAGRMPLRKGIDGPPNVYLTDGQWPYGTVRDPLAGYAQTLARNLGEAIGERSLRSVATSAGVDHTTISAVLTGERWADMITVARLEIALGTKLWPDR